MFAYRQALALIIVIMIAFQGNVIAEEAMATESVADVSAGKAMFEAVCSYCHNTNYDEKIGPGLAGIFERRDIEWVDRWLKDTVHMLKTDEYAQTLHDSNAYGMSMPQIPDMKDDHKRANVIAYLKTL